VYKPIGRRCVALAMLAVLVLVPARAWADGYQVVANGGVGAGSLAKEVISQMFLKKVPKWPDGKAVVPVDLARTAATRDAFSKAVHGRGAAAIVSFWQQQLFSGADVPPAEKPGDTEVLAFVRTTPGAIGYVSAAASVGDGIKVIAVK
jgi:ABC-type phosphate transport system substrate-binding protein